MNSDRAKEMLREILIDTKRVCEKNNLKYYLVGGTLLGAIRHEGFIPWDDDIDIAMPREDYEKFIELSSELNKNYIITTYNNTNNYPYNFAKVQNKKTTLIEEAYEHRGVRGGLYIDIFPLDGVPEGKFTSKIHLLKIKILKNVLILHYSDLNKKRNFLKKVFIKLIQLYTSEYKLHEKLNKSMKKYKFSEEKYISNYVGAYGDKEIVEKKLFDEGVLVKFEKEMFIAPKKYDRYLKKIYGDYMKLPPIEKRKSHHGIKYLDLNKSY